MDFKINFGLLCVTVLFVICHRADAAANATAAPTATPAPTNATAAPGSTAAPVGVSTAAPVGVSTAAPGGSSVTAAASTTPAPITCFGETCPGNCSTVTLATTCASDTTNGCKTEIGAKGDSYTFSCNTGTCTASDTVKCCNTANCNTYAAAQPQNGATTMFANLLSITFAVMFALHV